MTILQKMTQLKELSLPESMKFKKNYLIYIKKLGINSKVLYLGPKVIYF